MVVHKSIYDYKNFKYLDDSVDYPTSKMIDEMDAYWMWAANEVKLNSYMTIAPFMHDAKILNIDRKGDVLTLKLKSYHDNVDIIKLVFKGVRDYRTYKTNEKGKLTRKDVPFWCFAYDDIVVGDRIQYTFAAWQLDWRCQTSYICGMIDCESMEATIE